MTLIPTIIEQSARSDRAYDLISCLLKERIILLTSQIDDTVSGNLCAQLLYLAFFPGYPAVYQFSRRQRQCRTGHLRYDAADPLRRIDDLHGHGRQYGRRPVGRGYPRQALRAA